MIVTIFGASGMVGKQLVKLALFKGYQVKAFGRNIFTAGFSEDKNLQLVSGTLFDEEQVYDAVMGSDAILSALGGGTDGTDKTRSLGMKNIVQQMTKASVSRIIAVGGMGSLLAPDGDLIMNGETYPAKFLPVSREHYQAYELLKASTLDWTFVCPPDIIDANATGHYITAAEHPPSTPNNRINAGDLALFMLDELQKNEYNKLRVGICQQP